MVSPFLPLTYAVDGMHAIIAGSGTGTVLLSVLALVAFGALSLLASLFALGRLRRVRTGGVIRATA